MTHNHLLRALTLLGALALVGCVKSATSLNVGTLQSGQGVVLGRIQVLKGGSDVTRRCGVVFNDANGKEKSRLKLDESGWVFSHMAEGKTVLSSVSCAVWNGLSYVGGLEFEVAGNGRSTYFGHVEFDLASHDREHWARAIETGGNLAPLPLLVASAVRAGGVKGRDHVGVVDHLNQAEDEAHRRFGANSVFVYTVSLAKTPRAHSTSEPVPIVVRKGDVVYSEANLDGVKLLWLGSVGPDTEKVAIRLQRYSREVGLPECRELTLEVDGRTVRLAAEYRQDRMSASTNETMQAEADLETLRGLATAKKANVSACSWSHALSSRSQEAASKFVAAYESMLAERTTASQPVTASDPPAPAAPAHAVDVTD
jgi:hypothetical protein